MAIYKDKAGHFTSKDNAGGECRHGVEGKTAKLKGQGAYAEWARSINPEATDKDILEGMADKYEGIDVPYDEEEEDFDEGVEESKPTEAPKRTASDRTYPYKATSKKGTALSSALGGDFTQSKYDKNIFEGEDGSEYVVATEEEAKELAKDEIKDFFEEAGIEGYTPYFQENIIASHIDEDELYDFLQEADPENADFLRDNPGALVEWLKENDMMGQLNGMVNVDSMAEDALEWDGIGHFLAQYDGEEIDLGNGLFAYRRN